jgi:hypothetical protein
MYYIYIYIYIYILESICKYSFRYECSYVCLSIFVKYILCIDFKFGILNFKIFMTIMILCKHYEIP